MPLLKGESIDLICADPPYNVGQNFANENLEKEEYLKFMGKWIRESYRILKDNGSFYMFHYFIGMWDMKPIIDSFDLEFINLIIWSYDNMLPSNKRKKYRWPLSYQPIFYYGKKMKRDLVGNLYKMKEDERKDVWIKTATQSNFIDEKRWHPSCKPKSVIRKIILGATDKGEMVLDPFVGSGTTLVMCKELDRNGIGIEIDKKYCDIAVQRLKNVERQLV